MPESTTIFGPDSARFIGMMDELRLSFLKTRYTFVAATEYESIIRNDPKEGMPIYWGEILARSHLTSVTAILRSRKWIAAILSAVEDENLLAFAAAFRGLIESAADASTALINLPATLSRDHSHILRALSGEMVFLNGELEDELIHFLYARRLHNTEISTSPVSHKVRTVREYIEILDKGMVPDIVDLYGNLCDLTHPGASSVWMWLVPASELEIDLSADQDDTVILHLLDKYRQTFLELLMFAFNPAIVTLRVLNYFPIAHLHVPEVLRWELARVSIWQNCFNYLKGAQPLPVPRLKIV